MTNTASLGEAIMQQPAWLVAWVGLLVITNLASVLFIARREAGGGWGVRWSALAILGAFIGAATFMEYLYGQYGYVRLLGLAHIVFWTPVYVWILTRRREMAPAGSLFAKYLAAYLVINGISLVVDVADVTRHVAGAA